MPGPSFVVEVAGGVPVVKTPREIDVTNTGALQSALLDAACDGYERFVVDMPGTRYCDASASHVLAAAHRRALDEGRQMLVAVSDALVLRVFALTGIDRMIPSFASLDEALWHAASGDRGRQRTTS